MAVQKQDDQHEHTFSNYVRIREDLSGAMNDRESGERGSSISVLPARHDDDDGDDDCNSYLMFSRSFNKAMF